MGNMTEWARREVEIACQGDPNEDGCLYAQACFKSALKAFESICDDGLTGFQVAMVENIMSNLFLGVPLSPIEDTPDVWERVSWKPRCYKEEYQCKRMHRLFKCVMKDGSVQYHDVDRVKVHEIGSNTNWNNGFISRYVDKLYPITMPYTPQIRPYVVNVHDFLTDRANGDYDTRWITSIDCPDGTIVSVNEYYKETAKGFKKISKKEFDERVRMHKAREAAEKEENHEHH